MVERIIVEPGEVRGLGNIVSPAKTDDSFSMFNSAILSSSDTVNGVSRTVYGLEYASPASVSLALSSSSVTIGAVVTLTATVLDLNSSPISDASVVFKVNGSQVGTGTTNSSGVATYSYTTDLAGSLVVTAHYGNISSSTVALTVNKIATALTITPPTLVYSDDFNVTGTLKQNNTGMVGETVTLHWKVDNGTEQTATVQTSTGGAYTFARTAPTTISSYKFWVTYAGTGTYAEATSSECSVNVGKETTVLVDVTAPSSVEVGTSYTMYGYLKDNDGNPISGADIVVSRSGSQITFTVTTDSSGYFTKSTTTYDTGNFTYTFSYAGDTYYTSVSATKTVTVASSYDSIVASANKSILSYADSEKATLYAQLKLNGSNASISGVTITFKNGSTTLGTATTDATGKATLTNGYTSAGVGDITITATDGSFVSETFAIEDCQYYNSTEKTFSGTSNHQLYDSNLSVALATNQEISFDVKTGTTSDLKDYRYWVFPKSLMNGMNYPTCSIWFDKKPSYIVLGKCENNTQNIGNYNTASNQYIRIKYVKEGTSIKVYTDNTLQTTTSLNCINNYNDWTISLMTWSGSETRYIKNVKFKPL